MGARWLKGILISNSFAHLRQAVEANVARFGFRYFMYHGCFPHTRAGSNDIYFDNCPEGWSAFYRERCAGVADPILHLRGARQVTPALWWQIAPKAPDFFVKAREFGLVTGSTHPVHGPGGQWSSMSFIKDRGGIRAETEVQAALARCQLLAGYVHDSAARIIEQRLNVAIPLSQPRPETGGELNERECQVLTWAAAGKTTSEIAAILPISERTVIFHLSNARRKLGASNSRHAISKALSLGLIGPGEAGPAALARSGEATHFVGKLSGLLLVLGLLASLFTDL
jgi:LuxR family transcriptional activator of bioluminescence operon